MRSLLLDTNIYGEMVADIELDSVKKGIVEHPSLIIFGSSLVREELRATPKKIHLEIGNLRIRLLGLYDLLTKERVLSVGNEAQELADHYYLAYKEFDGALGKGAMNNDFLLVSSACLKGLDIVVSNDESSMKSAAAMRAYYLVNSMKKLLPPSFLNYEEFKKLLR